MTNVMYMGLGDVHPPCYCVFLRAVLKQLGVEDIPFISHGQVRWGGSVVFFDTADAPENWPILVEHYCTEGNVVIVISDDVAEAMTVICRQVPEAGEGESIWMLRTWEAGEVRAVFQQAVGILESATPTHTISVT